VWWFPAFVYSPLFASENHTPAFSSTFPVVSLGVWGQDAITLGIATLTALPLLVGFRALQRDLQAVFGFGHIFYILSGDSDRHHLADLHGEERLLAGLGGTEVSDAFRISLSEARLVEAGEGYRSGYYSRTLVTRVGRIELRVPQNRQGRFRTEVHGGERTAAAGLLRWSRSPNGSAWTPKL
jgi:hypothetical protein